MDDLCTMRITASEFILYVADQQKSTQFYRVLLGRSPDLEVPGMTEFQLGQGAKLGLMPEQGIARILCGPMPQPAQGSGIPRCELYLLVDDLPGAMRQAEQAGARPVDAAADRDWGHRVAYFADTDGHVIALAQVLGRP
jgi:predicted enzyme related to lactoylglutathione lyase